MTYWKNQTNSEGFQETITGSFVSTLNSSTANIANGGSFVGEWETNPYRDVETNFISDVALTQYYDFSLDGCVTYSSFPTS